MQSHAERRQPVPTSKWSGGAPLRPKWQAVADEEGLRSEAGNGATSGGWLAVPQPAADNGAGGSAIKAEKQTECLQKGKISGANVVQRNSGKCTQSAGSASALFGLWKGVVEKLFPVR
jgi:hypothetical protein